MPVPRDLEFGRLESIALACVALKQRLVANDLTERGYAPVAIKGTSLADIYRRATEDSEGVAAVLHALEGVSDHEVFVAYGIKGDDLAAVLDETGTPGGWFPLIPGYGALPPLSGDFSVQPDILARAATDGWRKVTPDEVDELKRSLRARYEAGPGVEVTEVEEASSSPEDDDEENELIAISGARILVPTETFHREPVAEL